MAKSLDKGQDKIQIICDALKKETLEPAQKEALHIVESARHEAERILQVAHKQAEEIILEARRKTEQERDVFRSSLAQASKQSLEILRQDIENKVFSQGLLEQIKKTSTSPELIAHIIKALINAIEKEGIKADLAALIPQAVKPTEVNAFLGQALLEKLKGHSVLIGDFEGGAQLKVLDRGLTLDLSDSAIQELLTNSMRKDFRKFIFGSAN